MMEVSIFYEDRLLSLEERTQGFDVRDNPTSQNRMRKLQSVLKKYNNEFTNEANYFIENNILSQKKLDYYRNIQLKWAKTVAASKSMLLMEKVLVMVLFTLLNIL